MKIFSISHGTMLRSIAFAGFATSFAFASGHGVAQAVSPHVAPVGSRPKPVTRATTAPTPEPVSKAGGDIIARIGDANITADDIRTYVMGLSARDQAALSQDPSLLSQAVRQLLANRLVLQEVLAKKWDQQASVMEQLDRIREGALVELYLQSVSVPPQSFPSDEDLQKVYDANRDAFLVPRQFEIAQIFVAAPKDADRTSLEAARKSLEEIQRKLKAPGADFAAVAAAQPDTRNGGDLGWLSESQIRPEIRSQIMGLAKLAVSEPIRLDDGWHILRLNDTKASYTRTLPEVHDQLVQQMRTGRGTVLRRAYLAEVLKQHPPALNELALSTLFSPPSSATK